jgi:transcriptional regulator
MHIPKAFKQDDIACMENIIHGYPFANLVTHSESGLDVTHIPFFLIHSSGVKYLRGHIAKSNPLWQNVINNSEVLVVFNGPDCYVSPNYYPTKSETGKAVPTWNYVRVHVKGVMSYIQDKEWNLEMLDELTRQHEAEQTIPWSTADAPDEYIQRKLAGVVGLEIKILEIRGQWKLSQNQPEKNRQGVVDGLSQQCSEGSQKIAALVGESTG